METYPRVRINQEKKKKKGGDNPTVHKWMNGLTNCGIYIQWNISHIRDEVSIQYHLDEPQKHCQVKEARHQRLHN